MKQKHSPFANRTVPGRVKRPFNPRNRFRRAAILGPIPQPVEMSCARDEGTRRPQANGANAAAGALAAGSRGARPPRFMMAPTNAHPVRELPAQPATFRNVSDKAASTPAPVR
ncbi:hypothetical protein DHODJN_14470 [Methylorubrum extorquens]